jgi:cyclic pyranopterin phosphate synthase
MPKEGIMPLSHGDVLTLEEIRRVAAVLTELGIRKIRVTGGEPLVRRNAMELIRRLTEFPTQPEIVMTTNGVLLAGHLNELKEAGVQRINISLDTLNRETYQRLTGVDALEKVLHSIDAALSMGFSVKLNVVPIRGINEDDIEALAGMARERELTVRFIELMPMGCAKGLSGIPGDELMERLEKTFGVAEPAEDTSQSGPAQYVHFPEFQGPVGFINPLSHQFCKECNRLRLTVDGKLKLCLFYPDGLDVKKLLRGGCTDEELKEEIKRSVMQKPERHEFVPGKAAAEEKNMVQIGG